MNGADRATTYHDGMEAYVKLGRLAVVRECRGSGIAKVLVEAAVEWVRENPRFFDPIPSVEGELQVWKGLMCVHAQIQVVKAWERWGFMVDEGMGTWDEEGIKHVGMFRRLDTA